MAPGLDFSAIPVLISAVSSGRLSTYGIYFLDFKGTWKRTGFSEVYALIGLA
jgi:hypothetical protein